MSRSKKLLAGIMGRLREYNNLFLLTVSALLVTMLVLGMALLLYKVSGTAQLDLSRPGYESARDKSESVTSDDFSPTGSLSDSVVSEFNNMYSARAQKIKNINAFGPEALSNDAFGIAE
ncbi:MAG: hypothetical protein LBG75_00675 [Candidatus Nomurabacteria bacterium]|nr:hypothetical protein [Candidatus Nomurabacteria bacterium]